MMNMNDETLEILMGEGILAPVDIHFAGLMARLCGGGTPELCLAAALVSRATREGHICLDLKKVAGTRLWEGEEGKAIRCPEPDVWCEGLFEQEVVGRPGEFAPLVLDEWGRLYLYRYWDYQKSLTLGIHRLVRDVPKADLASLKAGLDRLFPRDGTEDTDWQKIAAFAALTKGFCVISGGPGTGKTTTVAKILVLLIEQTPLKNLRIALVAPTGKGAARLEESIRRSRERLDCAESVKWAVSQKTSTIHRLLGSVRGSPYFRYNARHPLPVDVIVVDEASMVDLALMSKLIQALRPGARLILLGDKDQLASVEAGAVLGDICDTGRVHAFSQSFAVQVGAITGCEIPGVTGHDENGSEIRDNVVELKKSYRFGRESGIYAVSQAVNEGMGDRAMGLFRDGRHQDIAWRMLTGIQIRSDTLRDIVLEGVRDYFTKGNPLDVFRAFERFRFLCALREGPYGVHAANRAIERVLRQEGLISPGRKEHYAGRPILITRNDYALGLFNGDMGVILPDPGITGNLRAFFPGMDGGFRTFHPLMLPKHETVFAMTVHKSQGSEFDRVCLLLPVKDSPVLTRELLYTGITRARKRVELWATEKVFKTAVSRRIERASGLRDALWDSSKVV